MPPSLAELVSRYRGLIRQFSTFVLVGLTATAAHFAALTATVEGGLLGPVAGSAVGFVVGGIVSYCLNHRFTFESTRSHAGAVPRFMVVAGIGFVLNALIMGLLVHEFGMFYLLAQAITTGTVMLWSFSGYRVWAFAHRAGAHRA